MNDLHTTDQRVIACRKYLLETIDRLHVGTDMDNLHLAHAIEDLIRAILMEHESD